MKLSNFLLALSSLSTTSAHSWLHCTKHDNKEILEKMKVSPTTPVPSGQAQFFNTHPQKAAAAGENPVDPVGPWFADLCHGWPRAKQNPGNWIKESDDYLWDLRKVKFETKGIL